MRSTWRAHASAIIRQVIAEHRTEGEKAIRAALREAYPYGQRSLHPYKIWCDEVKRQLRIIGIGKRQPPPPGQIELF